MKKVILLILLIGTSLFAYLTYNLVTNNKIYKDYSHSSNSGELLYSKLYMISTRITDCFEDKLNVKKTEKINSDKVYKITGIHCEKDYLNCIDEFYDLDDYIDAEKDKILDLRKHVSQEKSNFSSNIIYYLDDIKRLKITDNTKEVTAKYNILKNNLENALSDYKKAK